MVKEFKRYLRLGITAAVGFVIASAWRDPIILLMNDLVSRTTSLTSPIQITSLSALLITVVGVILLWIFSKVLK